MDDSLHELAELARAAGAEVMGTIRQRLFRPTSYYLGRGKLEEVKQLKALHKCSVVIFDDELSPTQQRNLEQTIGEKVIDRTALILDIFASRARTREGQLQVELAQHEYLMPRLAGQWSHLERLGGGIATRGPGETQIETDRRLIRGRIKKLKEQLERVIRHRTLHRGRRRKSGLPVVSLVGYTNAGKSTLFNRLSNAGVTSKNQLFSTLDPITRRIRLPLGDELLVTDTVGFIHKLPPTVVSAFRGTLEDLHDADVLLHVADISSPMVNEQIRVVEDTLDQLGMANKPKLLVLNKADLIKTSAETIDSLLDPFEDQEWLSNALDSNQPKVLVSAITGRNVDGMLETLQRMLANQW
jgi:GTP-binding protein HflX